MERVYTRPLLDKLGVKPGARVAVVDVRDESFLDELRERTNDVTLGLPERDTDLVFLAADSPEELARLPAARAAIKSDGAVWVVSLKGKAATLRDLDVIGAAKEAGLVDNKVVSFSGTHTALRLVVPVAQRTR